MADYRDIYSYLISDTPQNIGDVQNQTGGDDPKGGSSPLAFGTGQWVNGQYQVPDKYKGIVDVQHTMGGGDDPKASSSINIDYTKLPNAGMTQFGRVDRTTPINDPSIPIGPGQSNTIKDPKLAYNDPNYGWITPKSNLKTTNWDRVSDALPAVAMTAASFGLGALTMPYWATALVNAVKTGSAFVGSQGVGTPFTGSNVASTAAPQVAAPAQQNFSSVLTGGTGGGISPQAANNLLLLTRGH